MAPASSRVTARSEHRPREKYRAVEFTAYSWDQRRSLIWSCETNRLSEIDAALAWMLSFTQGARSVQEHADAIASAGSAGNPAGLAPALEELRHAGLLRPCPAFDPPPDARSTSSPTGIATIGLITADRPAALRRSISSLAAECAAYGHHPRIVVVDGSRLPDNRAETRAAVTAVARTTGHRAEYLGVDEAADFTGRLIGAGAEQDWLTPGGIGANRNLLLLLTAGEDVLCVDDDVVCKTWMPAHAKEGLVVTGHHHQFREMTFFPNRSAALDAIVAARVDLLAAHGRLLGHSLASLVRGFGSETDLSTTCGHLLSGLVHGGSHVVKATFAGLAGDDGGYCPHRRLFSPPFLRDRLWSDFDQFRTSMTSREMIKVATSALITHDANFQTYCMGLSNRSMVPPFMPVGRNEDGVFGAMLAAHDPATAFGHIPVGILHDSDRPPERTEVPMLSARESRLAELVIHLVRRCSSALVSPSPAVRLQRLGEMLVDVASLDEPGLVDLVAKTTLEVRMREFEDAEEAAADPRCPPYWRTALDEYRAEFLKHAVRPDFFLPVEFHDRGSMETGYRALRDFLRDFGRLVLAWPALWTSARDLNAARLPT